MKLTYKTPTKLVVTLTDLLTRNEKSFSDVTDVIFFIKANATDTDESALVTKTVGTGITIAADTIEIQITGTDYGTGKLMGKNVYLLCFGIEFNSSGEYIEDYDPLFKRTIEILRDKIRA